MAVCRLSAAILHTLAADDNSLARGDKTAAVNAITV
jgi:hypothetical protein